MLNVTRRGALGAAAAATAAAATGSLPMQVDAAVPAQTGQQGAGFYRFKVGAFEVTTLFEGVNRRGNLGDGFIRNADLPQIEAALRDAFLPTTHLDIPFTVPVVNTGSALVYFDTGTGGQLAPTAREGERNRQAAGIDPAAVTHVLFTHFHGDHISGLTTADGKAVFPNARLYVPEPEWAHWMDDAVMSRAPQGAQGGFRLSRAKFGAYEGKIERFTPGSEILPGIRSEAAYGHTPGHSIFRVSSGNAQLIVLGDTSNTPALFARNPDWQLQFDMDGPVAAATRKRIYGMAAADRIPVVGYHFPFPAVGHFRAVETGFDFVQMPWTTIL